MTAPACDVIYTSWWRGPKGDCRISSTLPVPADTVRQAAGREVGEPAQLLAHTSAVQLKNLTPLKGSRWTLRQVSPLTKQRRRLLSLLERWNADRSPR